MPSKATVETSQIVSVPVPAKPKVRLATTSKGVPRSRATELGVEREVTELSTRSVAIHQSKAASSADLEPIREPIRPTSTPKAIGKVLPKPPVKAAPVAAEASTTSKSPPSKAIPVQLSRPDPVLLPDRVLAYERSQGRAGDIFEELRSYRNFSGLLLGSGVERKFSLFLEYHQVLDRGVAESASWWHKIPKDNVALDLCIEPH